MAEFGDYEPEDAWDATDPPTEQLENIRRRIALLVLAAASGGWGQREDLRALQVDEDVRFVIGRL